MPKERVEVVLVALSTPLLVGIYKDGKLQESITSNKRSSEVLAAIYKELFSRYNLVSLIYANGPGSFLSIKIAYVFLRSLSILKGIPLLAMDAFCFNDNRPIKALGKLYFVKIQEEIRQQKLEEAISAPFKLPQRIYRQQLSSDNTPMYIIGAV